MLTALLLAVAAFQPQPVGTAPSSEALSFDPPMGEGLEVAIASGASSTVTLGMTNTGTAPVEYVFPHFTGTRDLGGPDAFGYSWIDSTEPHGPTFDDVDIRHTGVEVTPLFPSPGCEYSAPDEGYQVVDLPFDFRFYGDTHSQIWISANGFVTFEPLVFQVQCSFSIHNIPSTSLPRYFMAPLWADLHGYSAGKIYVEHLPDGRFVFQWTDWSRFGQQGSGNTFQAMLYPSGEVRFQYLELNGTFGDPTRVGIENQDGTVGLLVASGGQYFSEGLAVRISTAPTFVTAISPASGTLAPGATAEVAITVNATSLLDGTYHGTIPLATDENGGADYAYPITLIVEGETGCVVDPGVVSFEPTIVGNTRWREVNVANDGTASCTLTGAGSSSEDFGIEFGDAVTLPPGGDVDFDVWFSPSAAGEITGTLTFATDGDALTAQLHGTGVAPPQPALDQDELTYHLPADASSTQSVILTNAAPAGSADLEFHVSLLLGDGSGAGLGGTGRTVDAGLGLRHGHTPVGSPGCETNPVRISEHGDELLLDGSFEAGTPNPFWAEGSLAFGSPICSHSINCNPNVGSGPNSGEWWVWLGGHFDFEAAFVSQPVTIPPGEAQLSFWLEMPVVPTQGFMRILMGDEIVFQVTGGDAPSYPTYQEVVIDMGPYADGVERVLRFETQLEVGSFFVDDVSLLAWVPIISMEPRDGVLAPGDSAELLFTADTHGVEPGTYEFHARIQTNVPEDAGLVLPITVLVTPVGTGAGPGVHATDIGQNHPNPFSGSTSIDFTVAASGHVHIAVYDAAGRRVATLVDGERDAGEHTVTWDAAGLASGVYFYRIRAGNVTRTMRALIVR